jgi:6-phosphogluconolactonase
MKVTILTCTLCLGLGVFFSQKMKAQKPTTYSFFVGTYTNKDSKGIYQFSLGDDGKLTNNGLVAESDNPSFLAKTGDGKYLVAVNEHKDKNGEGEVELFLIEAGGLKLINSKSSGGTYPCYITVNKDGFVFTANYGNGKVGLLKINSSGKLEGPLDIQEHKGSGNTTRQEGPHAHSVWFGEDEQDIISIDLGTNELWFSKLDLKNKRLIPKEPNKLAMEAGAGPRHMAFHPNKKWAYVLNELTSTVTILDKASNGNYQTGVSISTLPDEFEGKKSCADIHVSSDGKFLYASNRGHNSIVIYKVNQTNGALVLVGHESTRGDSPRNFSLSPNDQFLLVANQNTNNIVSFLRDEKKGTLKFVDQIEAPTPVCILF